MKRDFNFSPTCIGSVPHTDAKLICEKILNEFKDIPFWPQLPKRSYRENMYAQFSEGLPNIKIDEEAKSIYLDTSEDLDEKIAYTYEKYLSGDIEYFAITEEHAKGFFQFRKEFNNRKSKDIKFIKGHITGPVSFGLAVLDEKKQSIFYNRELQEVLTKVLCMKAKWQIEKMKELHKDIIIFIDEPYMVSIGSSYVNIKSEDAVKRIGEVIDEIHNSGALAGIHCCGNTDWGLLLKTDIDIINFDAYNFIDSIVLYPDELKRFLELKKSIAWGIVPTSFEKKEDSDSLLNRMSRGFDILFKKGIKKEDFLNSSIVTPSCGCGTLSEQDAEKVLSLTIKISKKFRK